MGGIYFNICSVVISHFGSFRLIGLCLIHVAFGISVFTGVDKKNALKKELKNMNAEQDKREDAEEIVKVVKTLPADEKKVLYGIAKGMQLMGQVKPAS